MRKSLILAASLVLGGLGLVTAHAPASAAVSGPALAMQAPGAVEEARMTRRERMMQRRMMRRRMMRSRMRSDPNSRNPSRPGYQQQKGNTSGGPRY